jgi:hypothetical protein
LHHSALQTSVYALVLGTALGCAPGKPAEYPLVGSPITVLTPKNLDGSGAQLKGVFLHPVHHTESNDGNIEEFSAVDFPTRTPGELTVRSCRGDRHDTGSIYQSCVSFDGRVDVVEEPEQWRLTVTPTRRRDEPGRNALFLPIDPPESDLSDWYYHVSHQSVRTHLRIESTFPPEALKANFDRLLRRIDQGVADGAIRQFKDAYGFDDANGTSTRIGVSFYPYHDGSLAELVVLAESTGVQASTTLDWTAHLKSVQERMEKIGRD